MTVASGPAALPRAGAPAAVVRPSAGGETPLRLAEGIDLVGEFEGSGFKVTPYLVRRADGQTLQVSKLLFLVAAACDGQRSPEAVAEKVSAEFGRRVSADNVRQLAGGRLRALGIIAAADGSSPKLTRSKQLLALNLRTGVVPRGVVSGLTAVLRPLFLPPIVLAVLGGIAAVDYWLFAVHGVAQAVRGLIEAPVLLLAVLGLVIVSAAFHECGHATACRYGGARPGEMGAGLYIVWPAFYTDVTDSYRLGKGGRLRTDLGGVYFNVIVMLALAAAYLLTGWEPALAVIALLHIEVFHQFLPFLRLDGYYIVSDLVGVPDLFVRLKPTLLSLIPWRPVDRRVDELKPWVRAAVTAWVVLTVPVLAYVYFQLITNAPRMAATAWESLTAQGRVLGSAAGGAHVGEAAFAALQIAILVLPVIGLVYTLSKSAARLGQASWTATAHRPVARTALLCTTVAAAALIALMWRPGSPQYRPISPTDRGTVDAGFRVIAPALRGEAPADGATPASAPAGQATPAAATTPAASGSSASSAAGAGSAAPGSAPLTAPGGSAAATTSATSASTSTSTSTSSSSATTTTSASAASSASSATPSASTTSSATT